MKIMNLQKIFPFWIGAVNNLSENTYYLFDGTLITDKDEFFDPLRDSYENNFCLTLDLQNYDIKNFMVHIYSVRCSSHKFCFCELLSDTSIWKFWFYSTTKS